MNNIHQAAEAEYSSNPHQNSVIARGFKLFRQNGTMPASTPRVRGLFHAAIQAGAAQCIVRPRLKI